MRDNIELGRRLKLRRKALGLTQQALADQIGTTKGAICNLELGRAKSSVYLGRIAQTLNVSLAWLEGREDVEQLGLAIDDERMIASCGAYLEVALHALKRASQTLSVISATGTASHDLKIKRLQRVTEGVDEIRKEILPT